MRNQLAFFVLICLLFSISCNKSVIHQEEKVPEMPVHEDPVITSARTFFTTNVLKANVSFTAMINARHKVQRTPLWDQAYIVEAPAGDMVVVPLEYESKISFNYGTGDKLSLEKQSKLIISKEKDGGLKAEVVIYFPSKQSLSKKPVKFEGTIVKEDWYGNHISKLYQKDGIKYKFKENNSGTALHADGCYSIVWYICDMIDGMMMNCEYVFTEYSPGCNEGLEPCGEGNCGGGLPEEEYIINKQYEWSVGSGIHHGNLWSVMALASFTGRAGRFEGIVNMGSRCNLSNIYNWTETVRASTYSQTIATCIVEGNGKYILTGQHAFSANRSTNLTYSQVFP